MDKNSPSPSPSHRPRMFGECICAACLAPIWIPQRGDETTPDHVKAMDAPSPVIIFLSREDK